ncbi:hypothetical protein N5F23_24350 [Pseudomonas sichuanensis]|uniref:hypothetical protein n=1 Tax=Pseudomonas sichuanensis TaxID=2213015 RepID=UPI002449E826|nr:hypothetical protein [Pseudomonas sichuanensis]MDH0729878.1 hypothetical protein [Pseudomonas sichuanensis]MDH1585730.1 hypothetical protein [Pseudomonas sichuanensis]MDH1595462.1 hypothetical protein [Pseudomonas sichuanensis]MDH1600789.1 hypothetical protein [Pseudomonas sichuanensis]
MVPDAQAAQAQLKLMAAAVEVNKPASPPDDYEQALIAEAVEGSFREVRVVSGTLDGSTTELELSLPDGRDLLFRQRRSVTLYPGIQGWSGDTAAVDARELSDIDHISLVHRQAGNRWAGYLYLRGQAYRLAWLGNGRHAMFEVDEGKAAPEAQPLVADWQPDVSTSTATANHGNIIRVLMLTTRQAQQKYPDIELGIAGAFEDANSMLLRSGASIRFELAHIQHDVLDEQGYTYGGLLGQMAYGSASGLGKLVEALQDRYEADLASMVITDPQFCGMAIGRSDASSGRSVISCFKSLGHELAHNLGVGHNWSSGDGYWYGYRHTEAPRFRTRMSVNCSPSCTMIPYFSTPLLTHQQQPIGTREREDAVRFMNERGPSVVAGFRPLRATGNVQVEFFRNSGYRGPLCTVSTGRQASISLNDPVYCAEGMAGQPRSMKVKNFDGYPLCVRNDDNSRFVCFEGTYRGDFQVTNFDAPGALPAGLSVRRKGYPMNGSVRQVSSSWEGKTGVVFYGQSHYVGVLCQIAIEAGQTLKLAEQHQCPADIASKPRSMKVYGFSGPPLCVQSTDGKVRQCFEGLYQGDFNVPNFDAVGALPEGLTRRKVGSGYMNGKVSVVSHAWEGAVGVNLYGAAGYGQPLCQVRVRPGESIPLSGRPGCPADLPGKPRSARVVAPGTGPVCFSSDQGSQKLCCTSVERRDFSITNFDAPGKQPPGVSCTKTGSGWMNGAVRQLSVGE